MIQPLNKPWKSLVHSKEILIGILDRYSENEQQTRPSEAEWSMLEIMEHLIISERGILTFLQKYDPAGSKFKGKWNQPAKSIWMRLWMVSPIKFNIPDQRLAPHGNISFEKMLDEWEEVRTTLEEVVDRFPKEKLGYTVFKHPLLGPLTMSQTLDFMSMHIKRHTKQANKLGAGIMKKAS